MYDTQLLTGKRRGVRGERSAVGSAVADGRRVLLATGNSSWETGDGDGRQETGTGRRATTSVPPCPPPQTNPRSSRPKVA